jgi:long-chain acyl-CoA synthetase
VIPPSRETLLDFFEDFASSPDTFVVHDDGYRVRELTYRQLASAARQFAERLTHEGVGAREKVVIWSENRAEWLIAFWGCLLAGAIVVPVDYRASDDLLRRITSAVKARVLLIGSEVRRPSGVAAAIWDLKDLLSASTTAPGDPLVGRRPADLSGASLAEIIFTSGATADPKGVTITHRNVLANVIPIEREIARYRRYARPFHPIRFLNLLPLSHMFGQSMATFVPPMLSGTVVFSHGYSPAEILHQIKSRRVSVLVCVPKVLDVLREHVQRVFPMASEADPLSGKHFAWRWWHYRDVHRLFGWKFWAIVCGAAPLEPELEAFWRKLGFLVVQGYGLTETAPVVTLNHPFHASRGTVGTPIGGVEIRIAPDGEILVRGDNVTAGYYRTTETGADTVETTGAFQDGWFHTGDVGELDSQGRLLIKGRKKEMIVTPQGLNVFPEDVERALAAQPGVKEAGVVGLRVGGEERVHAVLVVEQGADVQGIVRSANATLEDHQRVWSTSIWPDRALPRTEGTQKLKRRELQRWAAGESSNAPPAAGFSSSVEGIVSQFASGRDLGPDTTLDELGLSSLDRVELMMALEAAFHTTIEEAALADAKTIGDLRQLVEAGAVVREPSRDAAPAAAAAEIDFAVSTPNHPPRSAEPLIFPAWNRWRVSWFLRRISLPTWILPLGRLFLDLHVDGLEHLRELRGPVIFAANHQSHMDVPTILIALPSRWRYRIAPAMSREFFHAHFHRRAVPLRSWLTNSLNYFGSSMFFNAFPLAQSGAGTRQTLRYIGELAADGYSVLIFPEGVRHGEGEMARFRPGVGMIAARLALPVVPVRLEGVGKVLHPKWRWPQRGPVRVAFGPPLVLDGDDYAELAQRVENAVRTLSPQGTVQA